VTAWSYGQQVRGRVAIVCVPLNVLKDIDFDPALSLEKLNVSKEGLACTGIKVWVLARGVASGFSACGKGAGLDMLWSERSLDGDVSLLVGYGPDAELLDISDRTAVQAAVSAFLPDAEVLACAGHDWRHDRYAQETWAVFRPGQITRYEPHLRLPESRLLFGGSHTAFRWPGFIDGAIESGFRTASEANALLAGLE
jgi:monoamine oxidase